MTPTEVFYLFLDKGLEPYERKPIVNELRKSFYRGSGVLYTRFNYNEDLNTVPIKKVFVERLIIATRNPFLIRNTLGQYGYHSECSTLTSFMKYFLYYMPTIIGDSKHKDKYLAEVEIPDGETYKRYWQKRYIKKWHKFLDKYIKNGNHHFYWGTIPSYELKNDLTL